MRAIGSGAVLLLLAACGSSARNEANSSVPENAVAANEAAPVAAANAAAPAPTPDLSGARALLDRLYRPYTRGESPALEDVYTGTLEASIARQSDDLTGLGADPFCDCQDFGNFRYTIRSLEPVEGGAVARVAIRNFGEAKVIVIRLERRGDAWNVADIGEGARSLLRGGSGGR
jgi:hypothetical protein